MKSAVVLVGLFIEFRHIPEGGYLDDNVKAQLLLFNKMCGLPITVQLNLTYVASLGGQNSTTQLYNHNVIYSINTYTEETQSYVPLLSTFPSSKLALCKLIFGEIIEVNRNMLSAIQS